MNSHNKATTRRGKPKFVLTINHPSRGGQRRRERRFFDTMAAAEAAQESVKQQYAQGGAIWGRLKPHEQADIMVCMEEARQLGTTIRGMTEFYKANSGSVKNRTLTLREMVNIVIQMKTTGKRRGRYVDQLKYTLERFARGRDTMPLSQVTPLMVNQFLGDMKGKGGEGPASGETIASGIRRLRTMFKIATKNNTYLEAGANPMNHVEMPYIDSKTPVIFTTEDMGNLLWVCRATDKQFLPYLVLGMFGGIRPEELEKLRWRDIHMAESEIVIEEGVSKTRMRRIFTMEPVLKAWLEEIAANFLESAKTGPLNIANNEYIFECEVRGDRLGRGPAIEKTLRYVRQAIRRHRKRLCKRSGVQWNNDILRKTWASYLMWKYENETKVAGILGNSPNILHRNYRGLIRRADGEKFELLTPTGVKNDPIALPVGGQGKKAGVLI